MNNNELNRKLPTHAAPDGIWTSLEGSLSKNEKSEKALQGAIDSLSVHKAPDSVWVAIEKSLSKNRKAFLPINTILRIAAALVFLLAVSFLIKDSLTIKQDHEPSVVQNNPTSENTREKEKATEKLEILSSDTGKVKTTPAKANPAIPQRKHNSKKKPSKKKEGNPSKKLNVSGYEAITRTQLANMQPLEPKNLPSVKSEEEQLSDIKTRKKQTKQPTVTRVRLAIHNDVEKTPEPQKRPFSFTLFRPISYSQPDTLKTKQNSRAMLAARINL